MSHRPWKWFGDLDDGEKAALDAGEIVDTKDCGFLSLVYLTDKEPADDRPA